MSEPADDRPWLPEDADETFDPLAHADLTPDAETPLVITPRGGAREVGRSCYQIDTVNGRYLVDCGLNQGTGDEFPDFRGLDTESIDAVFLTHAHVDHCGGLPVLEARGLLADEAPIIATPPTSSIATLLLEDSLKIHRRRAARTGTPQRFTERDVERVYERFTTVDYGGGRVEGLAPVPDEETLVFQFGNAAHLLGSAWVMLQIEGYRAVFSGDIGNRATHLPDLTPPPEADLLVLESTYGGTHSHPAYRDARSSLYGTVERAIQNREPVLIPTFAVGRAQLLQLLFAERLHQLSSPLHDRVQLVVDGLAQDATSIYHEYVTDTKYIAESLANRVTESGQEEPFHPEGTKYPDSDGDRRQLLARAARGEIVPVIISPSGMLSGGHSPRYLVEFAARFGSARVLLTGYQAQNTTGRTLQAQRNAGNDELTITTDAEPFGTDWPDTDSVTWTSGKSNDPTDRVTRASLPGEWVETVDGLSAHAAQSGLLEFARTVSPTRIALVHGPEYAQQRLGPHLAKNVTGVEGVTRSRLLTPLAVTHDHDPETAVVRPPQTDSSGYEDLDAQLDHLADQVATLSEVVADTRTPGFSEAEIREIVREELEQRE